MYQHGPPAVGREPGPPEAESLLDGLGIGLLPDLRGPIERTARPWPELPSGVRVHPLPVTPAPSTGATACPEPFGAVDFGRWYAESAVHYADLPAEAVHLPAAPSCPPTLIHCTAGRDRTGIVIAAVLELRGATAESITGRRDRRLHPRRGRAARAPGRQRHRRSRPRPRRDARGHPACAGCRHAHVPERTGHHSGWFHQPARRVRASRSSTSRPCASGCASTRPVTEPIPSTASPDALAVEGALSRARRRDQSWSAGSAAVPAVPAVAVAYAAGSAARSRIRVRA
ncbi:tyrosine-protein phosphatase [Embleya sp. NPDC050154]|uniref:tyrosine-protein phosphatase n=1 Tax=Embleya sp. NPDC050154 TaxID=3363988 RepID=UPI00379B1AC2